MAPHRWSFGPFEFDAGERCLMRAGVRVASQPKPLDLLEQLLLVPGRILSREALEAALYPDVTVTSTALRNVVLKLREALGPEHEAWIETVPRRGVRFVGPVTVEHVEVVETPVARTLHLPAERDRFVGRARDQAVLDEVLGTSRLVSILGPGGVGKTRLAIHHGWTTLERWVGGVWFCDLSDARSVDAAVSVVASVLELPPGPDDAVARIGRVLAMRGRCLLVLDNFEQLASTARALVGAWLDRAPELRIVVTTRILLQLAGEHALDLGPLDGKDAEDLFVARARAADPRWNPSSEPGLLASLVAMLDALPLAIELAAARIRMMSLTTLVERTSRRFELLASTGGRHARHATLRATLDDSWELLSAAERTALARLSVFDGGFTLAAAEHVLDGADARPADLVRGLVDQSLVRFVGTGSGTERFELLASVRQYAGERLEEADRAPAELRHGAWFARVGRDADADATSDSGVVLAPDLANLTIACRRAIARGDAVRASETLTAVWAVVGGRGPFALALSLAEAIVETTGRDDPAVRNVQANALMKVGRLGEALGAYRAARALAETGTDRALLATILANHAGCLMAVGDHGAARAALEAALAELGSVSALRTEAAVRLQLSDMCRLEGQIEAARVHSGESLAIARSLGDGRGENRALVAHASSLQYGLGRTNEARVHFTEALAMARARGDRWLEAVVLGKLGILDREVGRLAEADVSYEAALAVHRQLGNRREEGTVLGNAASLALARGRPEEARTRYEAALAIHREVGNRRLEGVALHNLAELWMTRDPARAEAGILEALAIHREVRNRYFEGIAADALGALRRRAGDLVGARAELATALSIHGEVGNVRYRTRTLVQLGRVALALGESEAAAQAVAEGLAAARISEDRATLAALLVLQAELEHGAGRVQDGRASLAEAEAFADGVSDEELEEALLRVRRLLSGG